MVNGKIKRRRSPGFYALFRPALNPCTVREASGPALIARSIHHAKAQAHAEACKNTGAGRPLGHEFG